MTQRRYKMHCMNNKEYVIDEEDFKKLNANSEKMLVRLKQVVVHPSSIITIEPFFVPYKKTAIADSTGGMHIGEFEVPKPLEDLFSTESLKLTASTHE